MRRLSRSKPGMSGCSELSSKSLNDLGRSVPDPQLQDTGFKKMSDDMAVMFS